MTGPAFFIHLDLETGPSRDGQIKRKQFLEEQIIGILKEAEAGAVVMELCRILVYPPLARPKYKLLQSTPYAWPVLNRPTASPAQLDRPATANVFVMGVSWDNSRTSTSEGQKPSCRRAVPT